MELDPAYSDFNNLDVKNKVIVAFGGEPLDENGNYFINGVNRSKWSNSREEISLKKSIAKNKGALALILVDDYLFRRNKSRHQYSDSGRGEKRMALGNKDENNFQVLLFANKHKDLLSKNNLKLNMNFKKNVQNFTADNVAAIIKVNFK